MKALIKTLPITLSRTLPHTLPHTLPQRLTKTALAAAAMFAAFLVTTIPTAPAEAQMARPTCSDRPTVLSQLAKKYHEAPVNMGLTNSGAVLEILASDGGTWTILVTTPQGHTCMVAAGEHWEPVESKKAGFTPSGGGIIH